MCLREFFLSRCVKKILVTTKYIVVLDARRLRNKTLCTLETKKVYFAFESRLAQTTSLSRFFRRFAIKIPLPIVYVCVITRYTSGRVLMRAVKGKEKTCYYPYHPSAQEDSEGRLTPKRFHSRPSSKEDLSPSRCLYNNTENCVEKNFVRKIVLFWF